MTTYTILRIGTNLKIETTDAQYARRFARNPAFRVVQSTSKIKVDDTQDAIEESVRPDAYPFKTGAKKHEKRRRTK